MKKIFVFLLTIFGMFCLVGCELGGGGDIATVDRIVISQDDLPTEINIEDFNLSDIKISVIKSDGSILEIPLTEDMLTQEDIDKLLVPGEHTITVQYLEKTTTFTIVLVDGEVVEKYTVVFKDHDGAVLKTEEVEKGKGATAPNAPTREGYTFVGWDKDYTNVTSNLEVVAVYEQNTVVEKYTVVFKDHDGAVLKTEEVEKGKGATAPNAPTREGYTFVGWDKDYTNVTSNLEVVATYVENGTVDEELFEMMEYVIKAINLFANGYLNSVPEAKEIANEYREKVLKVTSEEELYQLYSECLGEKLNPLFEENQLEMMDFVAPEGWTDVKAVVIDNLGNNTEYLMILVDYELCGEYSYYICSIPTNTVSLYFTGLMDSVEEKTVVIEWDQFTTYYEAGEKNDAGEYEVVDNSGIIIPEDIENIRKNYLSEIKNYSERYIALEEVVSFVDEYEILLTNATTIDELHEIMNQFFEQFDVLVDKLNNNLDDIKARLILEFEEYLAAYRYSDEVEEMIIKYNNLLNDCTNIDEVLRHTEEMYNHADSVLGDNEMYVQAVRQEVLDAMAILYKDNSGYTGIEELYYEYCQIANECTNAQELRGLLEEYENQIQELIWQENNFESDKKYYLEQLDYMLEEYGDISGIQELYEKYYSVIEEATNATELNEYYEEYYTELEEILMNSPEYLAMVKEEIIASLEIYISEYLEIEEVKAFYDEAVNQINSATSLEELLNLTYELSEQLDEILNNSPEYLEAYREECLAQLKEIYEGNADIEGATELYNEYLLLVKEATTVEDLDNLVWAFEEAIYYLYNSSDELENLRNKYCDEIKHVYEQYFDYEEIINICDKYSMLIVEARSIEELNSLYNEFLQQVNDVLNNQVNDIELVRQSYLEELGYALEELGHIEEIKNLCDEYRELYLQATTIEELNNLYQDFNIKGEEILMNSAEGLEYAKAEILAGLKEYIAPYMSYSEVVEFYDKAVVRIQEATTYEELELICEELDTQLEEILNPYQQDSTHTYYLNQLKVLYEKYSYLEGSLELYKEYVQLMNNATNVNEWNAIYWEFEEKLIVLNGGNTACEHISLEVTDEFDSTCSQAGYIIYRCIDCGYEKTEAKPMIEHNYVDGKCSDCGALETIEIIYECVYSEDYDDDGIVDLQMLYNFLENGILTVAMLENIDGVLTFVDSTIAYWVLENNIIYVYLDPELTEGTDVMFKVNADGSLTIYFDDELIANAYIYEDAYTDSEGNVLARIIYEFREDNVLIGKIYELNDSGELELTEEEYAYWMQEGNYLLMYFDSEYTDYIGRFIINKDGTIEPFVCTEHEYVDVYKEPTCTEDGYDGKECSICGSGSAVALPALGHEYDEDGKCIRCGKGQDEVDVVYTFEYNEYTEDGTIEYVEAYEFTSTGIVNAYLYENIDGALTVVESASAYWTESDGYVCIYLDEEFRQYTGMKFLVNADGTLTFVDDDSSLEECKHENMIKEVTEATCLEPGSINNYCPDCGLGNVTMTSPLGHDYDENGNCTRCGEARPETGEIVYVFEYAAYDDSGNPFMKVYYEFYETGNMLAIMYQGNDSGEFEQIQEMYAYWTERDGYVCLYMTEDFSGYPDVKFVINDDNSLSIYQCPHENYIDFEIVEATCTMEGHHTLICDDCGHAKITSYLPMLEHTYDEAGYCTMCGIYIDDASNDDFKVRYEEAIYYVKIEWENLCSNYDVSEYQEAFDQIFDCIVNATTSEELEMHLTAFYALREEIYSNSGEDLEYLKKQYMEKIYNIASPYLDNEQVNNIYNTYSEAMYYAESIEELNALLEKFDMEFSSVIGSIEKCTHETMVTERTDATCTTPGYIYYYCNDCGYSNEEYLPCLGHYYEGDVCVLCGEVYVDHGEIVYVFEFDEDGYKVYYEFYADSVVIGRLFQMNENGEYDTLQYAEAYWTVTDGYVCIHLESDFSDDPEEKLIINEDGTLGTDRCAHNSAISTIIEATCTTVGVINTYCDDCGAIISREYINMLAHSYDETGVCIMCGTGEGTNTDEINNYREVLLNNIVSEWNTLCSMYDVSAYQEKYVVIYETVKTAETIDELYKVEEEFNYMLQEINQNMNQESYIIVAFDTPSLEFAEHPTIDSLYNVGATVEISYQGEKYLYSYSDFLANGGIVEVYTDARVIVFFYNGIGCEIPYTLFVSYMLYDIKFTADSLVFPYSPDLSMVCEYIANFIICDENNGSQYYATYDEFLYTYGGTAYIDFDAMSVHFVLGNSEIFCPFVIENAEMTA